MASNKDFLKLEIKQNNISKTLSELASKKKKVLVAWGTLAVNWATKIITQKGAVDTGRLRQSITHQEGRDYVEIGTDVEYGKYVELGTYKMKKRPFIVPAITEHKSEYEQLLKDILNG